MKKLVFFLVCIFAVQATVWADNHKPIQVGELPAKAQTFITTHFKDKQVALATVESGMFYKSYDVIFTNGDKLEFDRSGEWKEIKCKTSSVPAKAVPAAIASYVKTTYPDAQILQLERDDNNYEVKLSNRLEITFNSKFQVIDIDD